MAVSRPDGLPLCEDYLDYNYSEKMPFTGDSGATPVALSSFQHADRDIALDPLSTSRRLHTDIAVFSMVIVVGPSPESIQIIVPDCLVPPVDNVAQINLRWNCGWEHCSIWAVIYPHRTSLYASPSTC